MPARTKMYRGPARGWGQCTLVTDVTIVPLSSKLPVRMPLLLSPCLMTSPWLYYYRGYQCFCICYAYLGYWRHHDYTFVKITSAYVFALVTLLNDVTMVLLLQRLPVFLYLLTLVTDVSTVALLPKLTVFLSFLRLSVTDFTMVLPVTKAQSFCSFYGYLGYCCHHGLLLPWLPMLLSFLRLTWLLTSLWLHCHKNYQCILSLLWLVRLFHMIVTLPRLPMLKL